MTIDYQVLREAAEQATQDEWVAYILPGQNGTYPAHTSEGRHCGYFIDWPGIDGQRNAGANARYIAAIPPKVVLALLDEIKRLEDTNIDAMCRIAELETNLAALVAENAGLKAFKTAVYQQMGVGCDAPEFSITTGLSNLRRFADTLHAIEREFFTKELPDEEHEGETFNECPLSWGMSVEQYVSEFRKCLAEVRAQGLEMFAQKCNSTSEQSLASDIRDNWKLLGEHATDFAAELRKGGNQ
ncbi:ead/Ea22-like family protein [Escherichia coli]|nr:ead/Ea22-like family protein [Escherichia coli]EFH8566364.1 ead/Ea22-like family protein [Escherichia coli]